MFIRHWINIALLLTFTYGSWQVITGKAPSYGWQYYFCLSAPYALLFGSLRAWHRCLTWRRMMAAKTITPDLSRGKNAPSNTRQHASILELACIFLSALSIAAILTQFGISNAALHIVMAIGSYLALRVLYRMVR